MLEESGLLGRNDLACVLDHHGDVVSDPEVGVESDPLADLGDVNAQLTVAHPHQDASEGHDVQLEDAVVDVLLGCSRELVTVARYQIDDDVDVDNLTYREDLSSEHVLVHVVVAVPVADHRSKDK